MEKCKNRNMSAMENLWDTFVNDVVHSDEYEEDKLLKSCLLELVLKGTGKGLVCNGYFGSLWSYEQFG